MVPELMGATEKNNETVVKPKDHRIIIITYWRSIRDIMSGWSLTSEFYLCSNFGVSVW